MSAMKAFSDKPFPLLISKNKPLIIPVFIPHAGCPHQCAFCNQKQIAAKEIPTDPEQEIRKAVETFLPYKGRRKQVELAFFGGNFLGLPTAQMTKLLKCAQTYVDKGDINGIRFSTRPDTIDPDRLAWLRQFSISTVEIGVQSMTDSVLKQVHRGHTRKDAITAIKLLKNEKYATGVQIMIGLPGETREQVLEGVRILADLKPDIARIYPLLVLKGSLLAAQFANGDYKPMDLESSVKLAKEMFQEFSASKVAVVRMGLQASDLLNDDTVVLAGPWHPAFGHLVYSELMYDKAVEKIRRSGQPKASVQILVHPKSESRLRGERNQNIDRLSNVFKEIHISIAKDESVSPGELVIK